MTVQYCSDLHLEFSRNKEWLSLSPIKPVGDILILAGDILPLSRIDKEGDFFDYLSDHFETTFWIPGNHEYYHCNFSRYCGSFSEKIRENIFLLNNQSVDINNNLFIFSTLWSQIDKDKAVGIEKNMSDFHLIHVDGQRFTSSVSNQHHKESVRFIRNALIQETKAENKIVVTHHLPTFHNYPLEYFGNDLNQGFATDLDALILETRPDYWIFGHHHRNMEEFTLGKTRMLTNQLGYVQYGEHRDFKADCILRL